MDQRLLVGVSQIFWLLSTIIDWDKMSTNDKNVLNRTNQVNVKTESKKNFNVTVFLTDKEQFVQDFHSCAKKTAQATLEMCKVVYDAKHTLTKDNFDSFCREIGQKSSDPTIRKYIAIGEKYYDFINYADKLPNAWTTIYNLTLINSNTFLALIAANENFAIMTAKKIKLLISASKAATSNSSQNSSNTSSTTATADSNVIVSDDLVDAQIDASEADTDTEADVDSIIVNDIEPQSQADELQESAQDVEDSQTSDTLAEAEESKKSNTVNAIEQLSDDFHVVIKFKTQPSKAKFKEFIELMKNLESYNDFNLEIKQFNDVFIIESNQINAQTLEAISKIASDSELASSELESK